MQQRRYNNRALAILAASAIGTVSLLALLNKKTAAQGINGLLTVCQLVSGSDYISQPLDTLFNESTIFQFFINPKNSWRKLKKRLNYRFLFTVIGLALSLAVSITLTIYGVPPGIFPTLILFMQNASDFGGLFNRMGRIVDTFRNYFFEKPATCVAEPDPEFSTINEEEELGLPETVAPTSKASFFRREQINYTLGKIGGFLLGIAFFTLVLTLVGITSYMPGANIIKPWLVKSLFSFRLVGVFTSAGGYLGRAFDWLLGQRTFPGALMDQLNAPATPSLSLKQHFLNVYYRFKNMGAYEGIFTMVGVTLGIALGISIIVVPTLLAPFGSGLPILLAAPFIMSRCVSGLGGLFNRLGSVIDRFKQTLVVTPSINSENSSLLETPHTSPDIDRALPQIAFPSAAPLFASNVSTVMNNGLAPAASITSSPSLKSSGFHSTKKIDQEPIKLLLPPVKTPLTSHGFFAKRTSHVVKPSNFSPTSPLEIEKTHLTIAPAA
jgi:hypothetical protein